MIAGDYNVHFEDSSCPKVHALINLFTGHHLRKLNTMLTRGVHCLDNVFSNVSETETFVWDEGISDHSLVNIKFELSGRTTNKDLIGSNFTALIFCSMA